MHGQKKKFNLKNNHSFHKINAFFSIRLQSYWCINANFYGKKTEWKRQKTKEKLSIVELTNRGKRKGRKILKERKKKWKQSD